MTTPTIPAALPVLGPGVDLSVVTGTPAGGPAAACGTAFFVGLSESGPVNTPVPIARMQDYANLFGAATSGSAVLSNAVEEYLGQSDGNGTVYVTRAVGPTPTQGIKTLLNSTPATTLTAKAIYPGAQSANISVEVVVTSGTFTLNVYYLGGLVRTYAGLATPLAALAAVNGIDPYILLIDAGLGTNPVNLSPTALSAGTDDRTDIVDAQYQAALDSISADLGPGQVAIPGRTTTPAYTMLAAHAVAKNRWALYDVPDQPTSSQVSTASATTATLPGVTSNGDAGVVIGFWSYLAPFSGTQQIRTVPGSATVAGRIAATDAKYGHAAESAAGADGRTIYATGISGGGFDKATRLTLNGSPGTPGAITAKAIAGVSALEIYGWRTGSADPAWYDAAAARERMSLKHRILRRGEDLVFQPIVPTTIADLANAARAELVSDLSLGALDPTNPAGAYSVDTSGNNATTKAQRRLVLAVGFAPVRTGEHVHFDLTANV